jgi:MFS family permease
MRLAGYKRVLANRGARVPLVLGVLVRAPLFAAGVVLTLHVVSTLHRSYGEAGLVTAVAFACVSISGPWRGQLLDRLGLRRVVLPSMVVLAGCWSVAPFVGYWPLFGLSAIAGLFAVPSFSIIRQAVLAAVPEDDRRAALALDGVLVEVAFMIGPVAGVLAATTWPTSWVLFGVEMFGVGAAALLWLANPAITPEAAKAREPVPRRQWLRTGFVAICAAAGTATLVLSGTDISIVAALRHFDAASLIGPVLAVWGLGSMVGGLIYGVLHRPIPAYWLLAALAAVTFPMAFAADPWWLGVLAFVAGLLCAPTITATVDQLSRLVPEAARGEALGWHGSTMTIGASLGAPLAGVAIDWWGVGGGLVVVSAVGLAVAVLGASATVTRPDPALGARVAPAAAPAR